MKNKLVIGYCTHFSKTFQQSFNKALLATVGLSEEEVFIMVYENTGSVALTEAYNDLWECAALFDDAILVFIHHDIHFKSNNWGKTLLDLFNEHEVDIIGVAGSEILHEHGIWLLDQQSEFNKQMWGKVWYKNQNNEEQLFDLTTPLKNCQTLQAAVVLDGVFIAFKPDTCAKFDEEFQGFHFYDVSFCAKNVLQGKRIAVTESISIFHESIGNAKEEWQAARVKFSEKYAAYLPMTIEKTAAI